MVLFCNSRKRRKWSEAKDESMMDLREITSGGHRLVFFCARLAMNLNALSDLGLGFIGY